VIARHPFARALIGRSVLGRSLLGGVVGRSVLDRGVPGGILGRGILGGLVAMLVFAALPAAEALALVTETNLQVTSSSGTYLVADEVTGANAISLSGTSNGSPGERLQINCYWGAQSATLARGVEIQSGGAFAFSGPLSPIAEHTCVLRAVPEGESKDQPPGTPTRFNGPLLAVDLRYSESIASGSNVGKLTSHYIFASQLEGGFAYGSLGNCALMLSELYLPITYAEAPLDSCDGFLWWENGQEKAGFSSPTRSELQVDGRNAYLPGNIIYSRSNGATVEIFPGAKNLAGFPAESYKYSVNPENGNLVLEEADESVACSPSDSFPPTAEGCTSFVPTGVRAYLRVEQSANGRQSRLTQYFEATDSKPHEVDLLEDNQFIAPTQAGELYLPWISSGFTTYTTPGQALAGAPSGPASLYLRAAPSEGPIGAITFAAPPEGETVVGATNDPAGVAWLDLHYHRLVPASGYAALSFTYSEGFAIAEAQRLAEAAQAAYLPQLTISGPATGTTTSNEAVVVSGSASDTASIASLTVDGQPVALAAGGSWSTIVKLAPGTNTIAVVATNIFGNSTHAQTTLTYLPPPPPGLVISAAPHPTRRGVAVTLSCNEPPSARCYGTERIIARVRVGSARRSAGGSHTRRERAKPSKRLPHRVRVLIRTLGAKRFALVGGSSRAILAPLNSYGRHLLGRLHRIAVTDLLTRTTSAGKLSATLAARTLELRALDIRSVKRAVIRSLRGRRRLRVVVLCPRFAIESRPGSHPRRRLRVRIRVRETNDRGGFALGH
jgi:hypothetical protein